MKRVLFICTHNSARSQMAEGWLQHLANNLYEAQSAGTEATMVRPLAIRAMAEVGIDISGHESKTVERFLGQPWDYIITVCNQAREACPVFPGGKQRLHWSFPDPSKATGTEEEQLQVYRRVRDTIRERIEAELQEEHSASHNVSFSGQPLSEGLEGEVKHHEAGQSD
ncbi:MAG: arsenate reductase ArsC [Dehalococcoidia bacterium]|nr:arsenate reductase ArsC [Dehalococcoidia bacterium]